MSRRDLARMSRQLFPSWPRRMRAKWVRSRLILGARHVCARNSTFVWRR